MVSSATDLAITILDCYILKLDESLFIHEIIGNTCGSEQIQ
jgi:hypothetical protein